MTFATELDRDSICPLFLLQIEGIGYVWSNLPIPAGWDAGGGTVVDATPETWTWQSTLLLDEVETVTRSDPWAGIPEAGGISFRIGLSGNCADPTAIAADPLLSIISSSIFRGLTAVQRATLSCTGMGSLSLNVDSTAGWPGAGTLYLGTETIDYTLTAPAAFSMLTRGRWRSPLTHHEAGPEWTNITGDGGAYVHDSPMSLAGRYAHLYVVLGDYSADGTWVPGDATGSGWYNANFRREIFHGRIARASLSADALSVEIECRDLLELLDKPIYQNAPSALGGHAGKYVIADRRNSFFSLYWHSAGISWRSPMSPLLARGTGLQIPQGIYDISTISDCICYTIEQAPFPTHDPSVNQNARCWITLDETDQDGRCFATFCASIMGDANALPTEVLLELPLDEQDGTNESILRELGFTGEEGAVNYTARVCPIAQHFEYVWRIRAKRGIPFLRVPRDMRDRERIIPYGGESYPGFVAEGWVAGQEVFYVQLEEAILPVKDVSGTYSIGGLAPDCLLAYAPEFGTELAEEVYVEWRRPTLNTTGLMGAAPTDQYDEEGRRLKQVIAWRSVPLPIALLYLLEAGEYSGGGGTWADAAWYGAGVGVYPTRVDETSLNAAATSLDCRRDIVITEQTTIRELLATDLVQIRAWFGPAVGPAGAMQLVLKEIQPTLESDTITAGTAFLLNHADIDTSGLRWDQDETTIVNVVRGENIGWNPGKGEGCDVITHRNSTSTGTWGATEPVVIDFRHTLGTELARNRLIDLAQYLYSQWSTPYVRLEIPLVRAKHAWILDPLDTIYVVHAAIPSSIVVGRAALLSLRVVEVRAKWRRTEDGPVGTIVAVSTDSAGWRTSSFAPCVQVTGVHNAGTHLDCTAQWYALAGEGADNSSFAARYRVRIYKPGNEAAAELSTIVSIDSNVHVTIAPAIAQAAPLVMEFDRWGCAGGGLAANQKKHVYMSAGTRQLVDAAAVVSRPFSYL